MARKSSTSTKRGKPGIEMSDKTNAPLRAVVDIGSNSVRLVIYDGPLRAPMAICNEKALCGLGRAFTDEGDLDPGSVELALATLKRFRIILSAYGDPATHTLATSAVREAKDGRAFEEKVRALGFDIQVISGEEEAELAALGVISVEPSAKGLAGDMGGGSLELISVKNGKISDAVSLKVGPLSIMQEVGDDAPAAQKLIEKRIGGVDFIASGKFETLYTVGGAWRSIARVHMNLRHYPLSVLHHYRLSALSAIEVCDLVARQSRRSLEEVPGISRKRIDTLPYAAVALKSLLKAMGAKSVVVSAGGVREGVLYRQLNEKERAPDPLLEAARFFSGRYSPRPDFGQAALRVIKGVFGKDDTISPRVLEAVCELADIAAYSHPDLRGQHAYDMALSVPFVSVAHHDRVWIAFALFCRYKGRNTPALNQQAISLLDWEQQQGALQVGLALRFVAALAPKSPELLEGCRLERSADGTLVFKAPARLEALMNDGPFRRLETLAATMECPLEIAFAS